MSVIDLVSETKRRVIARYPRFGGEVADTDIFFNSHLKYHTAATDGKNIYFDPDYFEGLSEDERIFVIAHEIMHIKFQHAFRLVSRDGKKKDLDTWNDATDAIINANLQRDGFAIKEGYINMPEALNYTADEFYQILLKEKQQQAEQERQGQGQEQQQDQSEQEQAQNQQNEDKNEGKQGSQNKENAQPNQNKNGSQDAQPDKNNGENGAEQNKDDPSNQDNNGENGKQSANKSHYYRDDHSLWQRAFQEHMEETKNGRKFSKNHENDQENSQNANAKFGNANQNFANENPLKKDKNNSNLSDNFNADNFNKHNNDKHNNDKQNFNNDNFNAGDQDDDEYSFDERKQFEQNREMRREIAKNYMDKLRNGEILKTGEKIKLGNVGEAKSVIDWKLLLRREVEKTETIWSQRRSVAENNFAYRLDENDIDDEAETEVMIDVSGSVSLSMVKSFLKQLKPLLKQSKLKVGCFNEKFWGMTEIKTERDIDKFEIPNQARGDAAWTEDWDLAVRSFSKKREVNKIVFTDGLPQPGTMPKQDLKGTNVIWIVYENKNFSPCCGTVILVNKKEFNQPPQNMEKQREL